MKEKNLAYLYLTLTVCIWGSLYVVSKFVLGKVPTFTILFLRYLIAGVILLFIVKTRKTEKIKREDYKYIFFIGFIGYFIAVGAQLLGTKLSNASLASLINSMNPVFIILFAVIILKEKLTINKVVAVIAAVGGAYIIIGGSSGGGKLIGIFVSIFSVITWALMTVVVRKITQKYDSLTITTYGIIIGMICTFPVSMYEMITTPNIKLFDWTIIIPILYIGVICTALAYVLWNKSLSMIEAGNCSLFYPLQPMVSVLFGCLFLGESINSRFVIGGILIIGGVIFSIVTNEKQ